ncbi:MAG: hypothetical protein H0T51_18740 [Pirellulales bacterium]|nr:hypothetical protein [Pirellulales bacterium]
MRILLFISVACCPSLAAAATGALRTVALSGQPAPGTPSMAGFNAFSYTPVLNAAGQTAFLATLQLGGDVTTENQFGIWSEGGGALALVARQGSPAPGTPDGVSYGSSLTSIGLNNAGQTAFGGSLQGVGVIEDTDAGIWSELNGPLELVAREGSQAPGAPAGAIFRSVGSTRLVDDRIAFTAGLQIGSGGVTGNDDTGVWSGNGGILDLVAREGSHAPGTPTGVIFSHFFLSWTPALGAGGQTGFSGFLRTGVSGATSSDDTGVWSEMDGALTLVAREGSQAPGLPVGVKFSNFGPDFRAINGTGLVAFRGVLQFGEGVPGLNDSGIWSQRSGPLALVAREGDQAPGTPAGIVFGHFSNAPVLNAAGHTAFVGTLQRGDGGVTFSNNSGIWSDRSGTLELVAREGNQAPGTPSGTNFDFMPRNSSIILNAAGQMAVFASLQSGSGGVNSSNNSGIWAEDVAGVLRLIVRTGDMLEVAPSDFRTVSSLSFRGDSGNEDGRGSGFNDLGQVAFSATFTDGSSGVFVSNLATVPEPMSLALGIVAVMLGTATMRHGLR